MRADYIYGINPVREGLRGRRQPLELFVDAKASGKRIDEILELFPALLSLLAKSVTAKEWCGHQIISRRLISRYR